MQKPHQCISRIGFEVIAPVAVLVGWAMLCQVSQVRGIEVDPAKVWRTGSNSLTLTVQCRVLGVAAAELDTCENTPLLCAIVLPCTSNYSVCPDTPVDPTLTFVDFPPGVVTLVTDADLLLRIQEALSLGPTDCMQAYIANSTYGFCKEGGPTTALFTFNVCFNNTDPDCGTHSPPDCGKGDLIQDPELHTFLKSNEWGGLVTIPSDLENEPLGNVTVDCGATFTVLPGTVVSTGACCDRTQQGGLCTDDVLPEGCVGPQLTFYQGDQCLDVEARGDCPEHTGACCDRRIADPLLRCRDGVPQSQCIMDDPTQVFWTKETSCQDLGPACTEHTGACCDEDPFGTCQDNVPASQCNCTTCLFYKSTPCSEIECVHNSIPTVSEWGLVVMAILLLTGAKVYFGRRSEMRSP